MLLTTGYERFQLCMATLGGVLKNSTIMAIPMFCRTINYLTPKISPTFLFDFHNPTKQQQTTIKKVNLLIDEVKKELNLSELKVSLRLSNSYVQYAAVMGSNYSVGGPVFSINRKIMDYFDVPEIENTHNYQSWLEALNHLPTDPIEFAKAIDEMPQEAKENLFEQFTLYEKVSSKEELKAVIAHELGHVKNNHTLQALALFYFLYSFVNPYNIGFVGFLVLYFLDKTFSRSCEYEADQIMVEGSDYSKGAQLFFKKLLLKEIQFTSKEIGEPTVQEQVKSYLWSLHPFRTHPTTAKRLRHLKDCQTVRGAFEVTQSSIYNIAITFGVFKLFSNFIGGVKDILFPPSYGNYYLRKYIEELCLII